MIIIKHILSEGMITVSRGSRKLPYPVLAKTSLGDVAYFEPYSSSRMKDEDDDVFDLDPEDGLLDDDDEDVEVKSISGDDWMPVIQGNGRLTMFIAGNPGAGKSYLSKEMIKLLPPTCNILLFTALEESDGNFDELDKSHFYKIKMEPEILSQISLKEIRDRSSDTLLLFDDVDKISDKKISDLTFKIMEDALANGRGHKKHDGKGDIHVICTSHALNDYRKTKYSLENSDYVALFPGSTTNRQMHTMFDKLGLDKELCIKMIRLGKSGIIRSIIIHKVAPMYIIFGNKIMLI